jgi:hypothetical protein
MLGYLARVVLPVPVVSKGTVSWAVMVVVRAVAAAEVVSGWGVLVA